ncbi:hypothetical protein [Mesorhizobium sp. CA4]|uniref:hypothetical protein n=1 Tax=Mesorhizobium sp. CA4 TaxID=588499 RepID=UPI0029624D82|nr:hypothetical protein [Mesorhizobium sp. CA4]
MKLVAGLVASVALLGGAHVLYDGEGQGAAVETASSSSYRQCDEAACAVQRGAPVSTACRVSTSRRTAAS